MAHKSLVAFWLFSLLPYSTVSAQSAPFYQDKTIRIVAGTTSGEDLQLLIKDLMNQTGTVIERVKNLLR